MPGASNEWYTPAHIFAGLGCHFDLDVAAPSNGPLHVPCSRWISTRSLDHDWQGFVWCNPPFGGRNGIEPWLEKFFRHGDGIALAPDRTSAPWFQRFAPLADALLFVSPKVKFIRPDGTEGRSPGSGTCLMAAGLKAADILGNAGCLGVVVEPVGKVVEREASAELRSSGANSP